MRENRSGDSYVTDQNFFERLKQNPRPVVVDFWAPWCGPCRMIEPQLKQLGEEYEGQVDVWKVNADEHPELLRELRIYGIPTIVSFNQGQEAARRTGAASRRELDGLFGAALNGDQPLPTGLTFIDRVLRAAVGLALLLLAYTGDFSGIFLGFAVLGGLVILSAIIDPVPLWRSAIAGMRGDQDGGRSEDE